MQRSYWGFTHDRFTNDQFNPESGDLFMQSVRHGYDPLQVHGLNFLYALFDAAPPIVTNQLQLWLHNEFNLSYYHNQMTQMILFYCGFSGFVATSILAVRRAPIKQSYLILQHLLSQKPSQFYFNLISVAISVFIANAVKHQQIYDDTLQLLHFRKLLVASIEVSNAYSKTIQGLLTQIPKLDVFLHFYCIDVLTGIDFVINFKKSTPRSIPNRLNLNFQLSVKKWMMRFIVSAKDVNVNYNPNNRIELVVWSIASLPHILLSEFSICPELYVSVKHFICTMASIIVTDVFPEHGIFSNSFRNAWKKKRKKPVSCLNHLEKQYHASITNCLLTVIRIVIGKNCAYGKCLGFTAMYIDSNGKIICQKFKFCFCRDALYCSKKCQKLDWEEHKLTCTHRRTKANRVRLIHNKC